MSIRFTSTKLKNKGKEGVLTPDEDGYYTLTIGGLNAFNSVNEFYTLKGAENLFTNSSILMRRITNGTLKGEVGHPKQTVGMSTKEYIRRLLNIEETNVCCHFKELWLDKDYGKNNPEFKNTDLVAVMAKVKPSGPKGDSLKQSLENKYENVCFSVRGFTRDYWVRGVLHRELEQIICWDNVTEPGISISTKWNTPSLESFVDFEVTRNMVEDIVSDTMKNYATEDCKQIANEIYLLFNNKSLTNIPSIIHRW